MVGRKRKDLLLILTCCLLAALSVSCGKKGNPTLKSYQNPEQPSFLSLMHREETIHVSWAYPAAKESLISDFILMRSSGGEFEELPPVDRQRRTFADRQIKTGSTYAYKIAARNSRNVRSTESAAATVTLRETPRPPDKLSYTVSGNTVTISWDPAASGPLFNIYKSGEQGRYNMTPLNAEPLSTARFNDAFAIQAAAYYTVRSLSGGSIRDEGPPSAELVVDAADLTPAAPRDLQAFPASDRVVLTWAAPDERWITEYRIYRKAGNADFVLIGKAVVPAFVDPEPPVVGRDYRVTACGIKTEGPAAEVRGAVHIPQP